MDKTVKKNIILYTGNFFFPDGSAGAKRVLSNAYVLRDLGYIVIILGTDRHIKGDSDPITTKEDTYGFVNYKLPYPCNLMGWIKYSDQFQRFKRIIDEVIGSDRLFAVITYGSPALALWVNKVRQWAINNNVYFIVDCVEWYSTKNGNIIFEIVKWIDTNYQMRHLNKQADGIIAISSYLTDYYLKNGSNVVTVPPLIDSEQIKFCSSQIRSTRNHVRSFIYAGTPFIPKSKKEHKDRLDVAIDIFYCLFKRKRSFIFNIYGLTRDEYLVVIPSQENMLTEMEGLVVFHGKVPHLAILDNIQRADFSILIRDDNRVSKAGFPTKFVESISCGTPVIANKTSDLERYLIDGKNGYWINNNIVEATAKLEEILLISGEGVIKMKGECWSSKLFDYRGYTDSFSNFLTNISR